MVWGESLVPSLRCAFVRRVLVSPDETGKWRGLYSSASFRRGEGARARANSRRRAGGTRRRGRQRKKRSWRRRKTSVSIFPILSLTISRNLSFERGKERFCKVGRKEGSLERRQKTRRRIESSRNDKKEEEEGGRWWWWWWCAGGSNNSSSSRGRKHRSIVKM